MPALANRLRSSNSLLAGAAVCLLGAGVSGYLSLPTRPQAFEARPSMVDLGQVEQKAELRAEFVLENGFREPVEVLEVTQSCGCTEATIGTKVVAPGEHTTVATTWKTGTSRGPTRVHAYLTYRVGEGRPRFLTLTVLGDVLPDIRCDPQELQFERGVPATQVLRLIPGRMKEFRVERVYCSHRAFTTAVAGEGEIAVAFDPKKRTDGDGTAFLGIVTDSPREPVIYVALNVRTSEPVQGDPP